MKTDWQIRRVVMTELDAVKGLFDAHKTELGFVLRPSLTKSIDEGELLGAFGGTTLIGAVHYHHRRDRQTTLYHIAVAPAQRKAGVGRGLVEALRAECTSHAMQCILLKCPETLPANHFYARLGFIQLRVEAGKKRPLVVWHLLL